MKKKSKTKTSKSLNGKIIMSVLQRGWVFVGKYNKTGNHITLHPSVNYRYQGSGNGFGFTAANGPSANCKLDKCPTPVRYHELTEVLSIECDKKKWTQHL